MPLNKQLAGLGLALALIVGVAPSCDHSNTTGGLSDAPSAALALATTGGTGVGPAQDATGQAINMKAGVSPIPCGGTGVGPLQDSTMQCLLAAYPTDGGSSACPAGFTTHTVNSGQTYAVQPCDLIVRLVEDAGAATAILPSNPTNGETHTLPWLAWSSASPTPPVINANAVDGGAVMVPFAGQASSAPGGLTTWATINTPGACGTWKWDGTEWVMP